MISLILFGLATVGLTNIIVHGRILDVVKIWGKSVRERLYTWEWSQTLFECYECTGFWAGLICGFLVVSRQWEFILACGFAGSVLASTYTDLLYWVRSNVKYEITDEQSN